MSDVRPVQPVRVFFGLVLAAGLGAFAAVAVTFLGLASPSWGWLFSAAVLFPCLTAGSLVALGPRRRVGYVISLVAALAIGGLLWWNAPPDHGRILGMVDDQDLAGFTVLDEEARGNTWCYKGCPIVEVEYAADDPALGPAEASERFVETLESQGWREDYRSDDLVRLTKGRWRVSVRPSRAAEYGYGDPDSDVDVEWGARA
jgi:hypothetical protein